MTDDESGRHPAPEATASDGTAVQPAVDEAAESDQRARRTDAARASVGSGSTAPEGSKATGAMPPDPVRDRRGPRKKSGLSRLLVVVREVAIVVVVALIASALLRAFVVQAFFVPSGSMLPTIQLQDRILVSRIGGISRGEVVVFEDPGNWIPSSEQPPPPSGIRKALEFVGVLPASGHEHLVKRVIGLPGDHVVCCEHNHLVINGVEVDESDFIKPGTHRADNISFDVVVPADHLFVLGDNRYVSGDSSRHLQEGQDAFVPESLVTGRAFAVIWPASDIAWLHVPDAYDDVPDGQDPPARGIIKPVSGSESGAP
ncbi:MAG TPA: signal peptidase I [Nocardioidaceae bacterium]|nr:signal peptidase I [Nocardioidaceae bacterium]